VVNVVELELDEQVSVSVEIGTEKPCAYAVLSDGEEVARYETSADIRKPAGRVGVRNVVFRHVSGYEKAEIETRLLDELSRKRGAIDDLFDRT
jgi:hypothetical protein